MPRCAECRDKFKSRTFLQKYCRKKDKCLEAETKYARSRVEQKTKKDWSVQKSEMKKALMTKPEWLNLLQVTFNTFIRLRDKDEPCISCGCKTSNKFDAGHLYPTTYSYLRFNEDNVNKQCSYNCNLMKSGNVEEYRVGLEKKIGFLRLQKLHNDRHKKLELSVPEIQEMIKQYKLKIKQLK